MSDSYKDLTSEDTQPTKPRVLQPQRRQWLYSWKLDVFLILTSTVSMLIVVTETERPLVKVLAVISVILMIVSRLLLRVSRIPRSRSS